MQTATIKRKSKDLLIAMLFLQFAVCITIFFNIPIVRQITGFIYFTFVPGFIIIKLLNMKDINKLETILLSTGLSIAFLMFIGLLIDIFYLTFQIPEPLSFMPLTAIMSIITFIGTLLVYSREEDVKLVGYKTIRLPPISVLLMLLLVLSLVGAMWVNMYESNLILIVTIIIIALIFIVGIASQKAFPKQVYPLAILMIALFLLYHSSLISRYLVPFGSDNSMEYYTAGITLKDAYWSPTVTFLGDVGYGYGRLYPMLSVTILPTVYSVLLGIELTWVFKILYPLIFSFVPLGLYRFWQGSVGGKRAFLAAFLLMAQATFYTEMLGLERQIIGELFFVLLLIVVFHEKMKPLNKTFCFLIFSIALVTAHYALAEIFLFFISFALIYSKLRKNTSRTVTVFMVVFFFIVMFSWYIFTSGSATFDSFMSFGNYVYSQLGNFLNPASRGQAVLQGLGLQAPPTIWNTISRAFAYLTEALIVFGFVGMITGRLDIRFRREFSIFILIAVVFLAALVAVPGLANTMNMTRFYHILLFFLAPLCVLGAEVLVKPIAKRRSEIYASILLIVVLVPYFLFQTGLVYEITGSQSWSLPLSGHRIGPLILYSQIGYAFDQDVSGAYWMSTNMDVGNSTTYADMPAALGVLTSYGMIYRPNIQTLSNVTILSGNSNVYLSQVNVINGVVMGSSYSWNTTSLSHVFDSTDLVYSNGGCEIYKNVNMP
jgi:uncharacterized membrane protein